MPLVLLFRGPPPLSFPVHPPRTNRDAEHARQQGDVVRALVAPDPHLAGAVAVGLHDGVRVEDGAVEEVERVAADHRGHGQTAPVDREAV